MHPVRPLRAGTNEDPSQLMPSLYSTNPALAQSSAPSKPGLRSGMHEDASQVFPGALPPSAAYSTPSTVQYANSASSGLLRPGLASQNVPGSVPMPQVTLAAAANRSPWQSGSSQPQRPPIQNPYAVSPLGSSTGVSLAAGASAYGTSTTVPLAAASPYGSLSGAPLAAAVSAYGSSTGMPLAAAGSSPYASYGSGNQKPSGSNSRGNSIERQRSSFEMQELRSSIERRHGSGATDEDRFSCLTDRSQKGGGGGGGGQGSSANTSNGGMSTEYGMGGSSNVSMSRRLAASLAGGGGGGGGGAPAAAPGSSLMHNHLMSNVSGGSAGSDRSATSSRSMSLAGSSECRRFTPVQVCKATDNFSDAHILGRGAFGSVYRGKLMGCQVAVKRLEGGGWQGPNEYRTEVEVLSRMRHPHIVLLMGHCPEDHCLVYEFLSGGSLQDFLNPTKRKRQMSWADRVRVLAEISSALLYLHHHEPPIAHRDLKPDNVLLDSNLTSKLGDVGLARLVMEEENVTARVRGTAGYIDPEEVITCEVSPLSDIYAFGLIALQLLLGEQNVKMVQRLLLDVGAANGGRALSRAADVIVTRLDQTCGSWNPEVARQLAVMAMRCADPKRLRRPDIAEEIHPVLQKAAEEAMAEVQRQRAGLETQLICPLSQTKMTDPVVAADGFTYERSAIETWLLMNDVSPSTGESMAHKFVTPNNGIRQLLG